MSTQPKGWQANNEPRIDQQAPCSVLCLSHYLASEEQTEIVRRVETLFAYADPRLAARYSAARAQIEKLTPALLAKAFRGELVPQDPNDEPATVLLQRIRAAQPQSARTRIPCATETTLPR